MMVDSLDTTKLTHKCRDHEVEQSEGAPLEPGQDCGVPSFKANCFKLCNYVPHGHPYIQLR